MYNFFDLLTFISSLFIFSFQKKDDFSWKAKNLLQGVQSIRPTIATFTFVSHLFLLLSELIVYGADIWDIRTRLAVQLPTLKKAHFNIEKQKKIFKMLKGKNKVLEKLFPEKWKLNTFPKELEITLAEYLYGDSSSDKNFQNEVINKIIEFDKKQNFSYVSSPYKKILKVYFPSLLAIIFVMHFVRKWIFKKECFLV